jgi:hypothetical protein
MQLPQPEIVEHYEELPTEFRTTAFEVLKSFEGSKHELREALVRPLSPQAEAGVGPHDLLDLARFKALMAEDGHSVSTARMLFDRRYAATCLAQALRAGNPDLRARADALFSRYALHTPTTPH